MRAQLAAVGDADAALETVTSAAAAAAQEMARPPWRCEHCATHESACRRAGPSGSESLCNGASVLDGKDGGWCAIRWGKGVVTRGPFWSVAFYRAATPGPRPPAVILRGGACADLFWATPSFLFLVGESCVWGGWMWNIANCRVWAEVEGRTVPGRSGRPTGCRRVASSCCQCGCGSECRRSAPGNGGSYAAAASAEAKTALELPAVFDERYPLPSAWAGREGDTLQRYVC